MALAISGTPNHGVILNAGSSGTITNFTCTVGDIIVVFLNIENTNAQGQHSGAVSDSVNGSYTRYYQNQPGASNRAPVTFESGEVWWVLATTSTSTLTITAATTSGTVDHGAFVAVAVSGANTSTPWDTVSPVPYYNSSTGTSIPSITNVSTVNTNTILFSFAWNDGGGSIPPALTAGSGFTIVDSSINTTGGAEAAAVDVQQQIFPSGAQTNIPGSFSVNSWAGWNIACVALQAATAGPTVTLMGAICL